MSTLCTLAQVREIGGIVGTADDARITALIARATATIHRRYGRELVPHSVATRVRGVTRWLVDLVPHELRSVTSVVLHPESPSPLTLAVDTDYMLLPVGGAEGTGTFLGLQLSDSLPIDSALVRRFGVARLQIAGQWGAWADATAVAEDVRQAAIETVLSWLDRPAAAMAGVMELGEPQRQMVPTAMGWDLPLSAHRKLAPYSRQLGVH